jgi:hypothetical protein
MPFDITGPANPGPTTLRVDPSQVLQLKADLQPIHDEVEEFLNTKGRSMAMQPLGADPVSHQTANAFNENAQSALDAAWGYLEELKAVLSALDQAVKTYNLVEDTNAQVFRRTAQ